jgi:hypothetical protein
MNAGEGTARVRGDELGFAIPNPPWTNTGLQKRPGRSVPQVKGKWRRPKPAFGAGAPHGG